MDIGDTRCTGDIARNISQPAAKLVLFLKLVWQPAPNISGVSVWPISSHYLCNQSGGDHQAGYKMNFRDIFSLAFRTIRSNKLRTGLTVAIIAFGIMALVGIITAIKAMNQKFTESFSIICGRQLQAP